MKRVMTIIAALSLILTISSGSVFAGEIVTDDLSEINIAEATEADELIANGNVKLVKDAPQNDPQGAIKAQAARSNGLTATITRVSSTYLRVTFHNVTGSKLTDTCAVYDVLSKDELISGPFSISIPAAGSKTYDIYVGNYDHGYIITNNHGYFYFD